LGHSPEPVQTKILRRIGKLTPVDSAELSRLMGLMLQGIEEADKPPGFFVED
jgi:hypothetical protein